MFLRIEGASVQSYKRIVRSANQKRQGQSWEKGHEFIVDQQMEHAECGDFDAFFYPVEW
jgi:hypothetical protein